MRCSRVWDWQSVNLATGFQDSIVLPHGYHEHSYEDVGRTYKHLIGGRDPHHECLAWPTGAGVPLVHGTQVGWVRETQRHEGKATVGRNQGGRGPCYGSWGRGSQTQRG